MTLKCIVKVNAINNLSDARYCAGMGVTLLGYPLDPANPNALQLNDFKEINEWLAGVHTVGEYGAADSQFILQTDKLFNTDYVEFNRPELVYDLQSIGKPLILTLHLDEHSIADMKAAIGYCQGLIEYFHLTSSEILSGEDISGILRELSSENPVLLGTGLSAHNVLHLLDSFPIQGIALTGSDEIRPGLKDYDQLAEILEVLELEP